MHEQDQFFMKEALFQARIAFENQEVPVGAVLVFENKVIARAYNQMEKSKDPTAHAELLCIRQGAKIFNDWRLLKTTLYTTLEPCPMCGGGIILSRIARLVWGAPDLRHGANGSLIDIFTSHPIHRVEITKGIMQEEAADLMRCFFQKKRNS